MTYTTTIAGVEFAVERDGVDDGYAPEYVYLGGRKVAEIQRTAVLESRRDPAGIGGEKYAFPGRRGAWCVLGHAGISADARFGTEDEALAAIAAAEANEPQQQAGSAG